MIELQLANGFAISGYNLDSRRTGGADQPGNKILFRY